jgi:hypothetical protein
MSERSIGITTMRYSTVLANFFYKIIQNKITYIFLGLKTAKMSLGNRQCWWVCFSVKIEESKIVVCKQAASSTAQWGQQWWG